MTDTARLEWILDHLTDGWLRTEVLWLIGKLHEAEEEVQENVGVIQCLRRQRDEAELELKALKDAMKEGDDGH